MAKRQVKITGMPSDFWQPEQHYPYFDVLLNIGPVIKGQLSNTEQGLIGDPDYVADMLATGYTDVKGILTSKISNLNTQNLFSKTAINNALSFLQAAAAVEAAKETAYIQSLQNELNKTKIQIQVPKNSQDWTDFVKKYEEAVDKTGYLALSLNQLKARLEKVRSGEKSAYARDPLDNAIVQLNSFAEVLGDQGTEEQKELINQIISLILQRFENAFIIEKNGELMIDASVIFDQVEQAFSLVAQQVQLNYYKKNKTWQAKTIEGLKQLRDFLKQPVKSDDPIFSYIQDSLIALRTEHTLFQKAAIQQLEQSGKKKKENNHSNLRAISSVDEVIEFFNSGLTQDLDAALTAAKTRFQNQFTRYFSSSPKELKTWYSELQAKLQYIIQGALTTGTGASGNKADLIGIRLTVPLQEDSMDLYTNIAQQIKTFGDRLKATNTTEYYQQQLQEWEELEAAIKNLLAQSDVAKNAHAFLFEDSTKYYRSLYGQQAYGARELQTGFHGGSVGPSIIDQLNRLNAIQQLVTNTALTKLSDSDIQWLAAVAINSGPHMAAGNQTIINQLEKYFSTFAAILMFDSQLNIVKEANIQLANNMQSVTLSDNVHLLHLFTTNNGNFPLSYILYRTYEYLKNTEIINESMVKGGAVATLSTMSKPTKYPFDHWDSLNSQAESETKLGVSFLLNFLNVLNTLFPEGGV